MTTIKDQFDKEYYFPIINEYGLFIEGPEKIIEITGNKISGYFATTYYNKKVFLSQLFETYEEARTYILDQISKLLKEKRT